jgi:hypothetical protein
MRDHASSSRESSRKRSRVPVGSAKSIMRMRQAHECEESGPQGSIIPQLRNDFNDTPKTYSRQWSEVAMRPAEDVVSKMSPSRSGAGRVARPPRRHTDTLNAAKTQPSARVRSTTKLLRSAPRAPTYQRNIARGSLVFDLGERTAGQHHSLLSRQTTQQSMRTQRLSRVEGPPLLSTTLSKQRPSRSSGVST